MELSKAERQILINQYEILKRLNERDQIHYDDKIKILNEGFSFFYHLAVRVNEGLPEADCRLVLDVLDMYRGMDHYRKANPTDDEVCKHPLCIFRGFDLYDEWRLRDFARYLMKTRRRRSVEGSWEDEAALGSNPGPMAEVYRRMLAKWSRAPEGVALQRDEVLAILAAADGGVAERNRGSSSGASADPPAASAAVPPAA